MRIDMDTCEEILITITRNKTRSLLTAFGVFWGIFMLVALIGGGQGLEGMMKKNFEGFATNSGFLAAQKRAKLTKVSAKAGGGIWKLSTSSASVRKSKMWRSLLLPLPVGVPKLYTKIEIRLQRERIISGTISEHRITGNGLRQGLSTKWDIQEARKCV